MKGLKNITSDQIICFLNEHYNIEKVEIRGLILISVRPKDLTFWKYEPYDIINELKLHFWENGYRVGQEKLKRIIKYIANKV